MATRKKKPGAPPRKYMTQKRRRSKIDRSEQRTSTAKQQEKFLAAYAETANIRHACIKAKIARGTHYAWLKADEAYAALVAEAEEMAVEVLEQEAHRRAVDGVREPVGFWKGKPSAYVRRYSDNLLMFLLKGRRPEKYRERFEHVGKDGEALVPTVIRIVSDAPRDPLMLPPPMNGTTPQQSDKRH